MKGLNKIALATAVAAAPFATQAMEPMNDSQMGDVTGQAGVTIELQDTTVGIDEIEYDQGNSASFAMRGVDIGGHFDFATGDQDGLDLSVDIDLVGEAQGTANPAEGKLVNRELQEGDALIRLGTLDGTPVQLGFGMEEAGLRAGEAGSQTDTALGTDDTSARLMSDISANVFLTQVDIVASTDNPFDDDQAINSGSIGFDMTFTVDRFDAEFDVAAVSLSEVRLAGAGTLADLRDAPSTAALQGATLSLTMGAGSAFSDPDQDALRISMDEFNADIYMPDIEVGGGNIGSVGIAGLSVNTDMAIYGREGDIQ